MTANGTDMPDAAEPDRGKRGRPFRVFLLAGAAIGLVTVAGVWVERKPIASRYIDRALAERGVPARYKIATIGLDRQRLTDVVIGDPADPDLVADWIEVNTHVGVSGVGVTGIRTGHVSMRARLVDGKVSLGAIDRLLPAPSGKPFALPAIDADIADARIKLIALQGEVQLRLRGRGRLNQGFAGTMAAVSPRLALAGCVTGRATAVLSVHIADARPSLTGPVLLDRLDCAGTRVADARATLSLGLDDRLEQLRGTARIGVGSVGSPVMRIEGVSGTVDFAGRPSDLSGSITARSRRFVAAEASGDGLAFTGKYRLAGGGASLDGRAVGHGLAVSPRRLGAVTAYAASARGTPLAPLVARVAGAVRDAGRSFAVDATISGTIDRGQGALTLSHVAARSASGAHLEVNGGNGLGYRWPRGGLRVAADIVSGGGGLPEARLSLTQQAGGGPMAGTIVVQPYQAGNARIALAPISFRTVPGGGTRLSTEVTLSGPVGDGRVDGLRLAITGSGDGRGRLVLNPACAPLSFDRLAVSGLVLRPARLMLCPLDGGLVRVAGGRLGGGARIDGPHLAGMLGSSPVTLGAQAVEVRLADRHFQATDLAARLGTPDHMTSLDIGSLDGGFAEARLAGDFSGGAGQIANVPLALSAATGAWRVEGGALGLRGTLAVADTAPDARFKPLAAKDVVLRLERSRITATGVLEQPAKGVKVADVAIEHDLGRGTGNATLTVPGLAFGKGFQPDELTRLTYGVIEDVAGTIAGEGHIRWDAQGVSSDGTFRTAGTDLAAAFGPVTGVAGVIHFTDLLNLESAPGQVATVKTLNPGIAVNDGTIRYQILPGAKIQVEEGRWPFAGGSLVLEPTLLDFGQSHERRMTFTVAGMEAGQFLQQFDFKNLNATGIFDGTLPMIFDEAGGRIEQGRLVVRQGGGALAYVGEVSQEDVGFWGNLAFQALKSLRYRNLDIVMNGPLAGEMITEVRFAGVGQGVGAKRNFLLDRLQKLPFIFNVRIKAPFRGLIDSAQSFYDPKRLIERNLPALLEEQRKATAAPAKPIQPPESRKLP